MENARETESIQKVIATYIQAYLQADATLLLEAFCSETRLQTVEAAVDGEGDRLEILPMSDWLNQIAARKAQGDVRQGNHEVLSIDVTGASAVAKLRLKLPAREFTDYLSLMKYDGRWKIV